MKKNIRMAPVSGEGSYAVNPERIFNKKKNIFSIILERLGLNKNRNTLFL